MHEPMQGRSDHDESLMVAYWCFVGLLLTIAVSLVREGVLRLWPLVEQWLSR